MIYYDPKSPTARRVTKPYKGWSKEKLLEAAIAATRPGKEKKLAVVFDRTLTIAQGILSCEYSAALVAPQAEAPGVDFGVVIHRFNDAESDVLYAQRLYWRLSMKLELWNESH